MTIDTNILIAYLKGEEKVIHSLSGWRKEGRALFISSISTAEILSLPQLTLDDMETVSRFVRGFISVPFDDALAQVAAFLRRSYRLTIPDAVIAATAISRNVPLVTRDRQFRRIQELSVIEI